MPSPDQELPHSRSLSVDFTQDALAVALAKAHPDIVTHLRLLELSKQEEDDRNAALERKLGRTQRETMVCGRRGIPRPGAWSVSYALVARGSMALWMSPHPVWVSGWPPL